VPHSCCDVAKVSYTVTSRPNSLQIHSQIEFQRFAAFLATNLGYFATFPWGATIRACHFVEVINSPVTNMGLPLTNARLLLVVEDVIAFGLEEPGSVFAKTKTRQQLAKNPYTAFVAATGGKKHYGQGDTTVSFTLLSRSHYCPSCTCVDIVCCRRPGDHLYEVGSDSPAQGRGTDEDGEQRELGQEPG
jgi:hypothetical protein